MKRLQAVIAIFVIFQLFPGAMELVDTIVHYVQYDHFTIAQAEGHHHHHDHQKEGLTHHCSGNCPCTPNIYLIVENSDSLRRRCTRLHLKTPYPHQILANGFLVAPFRPPRSVA
ncbi:hypothetical protein KKF84_02790 [Myxococcota bacterium]|nr:hypothetical protein [Myxococcota bacterium]MBU1534217.1 hypothetical protein [Myxococcota bacterium]